MTAPSAEHSGVVILDKPEGPTSHDAVARMRRVLRTRRVGHAGTLDPMASGVLVVAFGRATRLIPWLQATGKRYTANVRLGVATTTDDRTGDPLHPPIPVTAGEREVDEALRSFSGEILQRPSAVSAVKVSGRRAYELVRAGEQPELAARPVTVHAIARTGPVLPGPDGCADVPIEVSCSSGTYIRALARDLGELLGCGGHLTALRRTASGPFTVADAAALPGQDGDAVPVLSMGRAAAAVLPVAVLDEPDARRVRLGQQIACGDGAEVGPVALLDSDGALVAVAEPDGGRWRYRAVFSG